MNKKWKILIVTAGRIIPEYYQFDTNFSKDNYIFFNVSSQRISNTEIIGIPIINAIDIPEYKMLGREWAESEVVYNYQVVFNTIKQLDGQMPDLIGLIHWDFNLYDVINKSYDITKSIESKIEEGYDYISFFPIELNYIINQYNILMDERRPNCLFVKDSGLLDPMSANNYILNYIIRNKEQTLLNQITPYSKISMCCAGIFPVEWFAETKMFMDKLIEDNIEQKFDTQKRHRFPGQLMERYVALDSLFRNKAEIRLDHKFIGGIEINKADPNGENY